jgi:hypothetical protein
MKYLVRQFFVVEVEVEAEDAAHAKEIAGYYDTEYNIVTQYTEQDGGPEVGRAFIDDEVLPLEDV